MMERLVDMLGLPPNCRIDQRVAKRNFQESEVLSAPERCLIAREVDQLRLAYLIDGERTRLQTEADDTDENSCIAFLHLVLKQSKQPGKVALVCHRVMPYPLVLELVDGNGNAYLSLAEKRMSRDGREGVVVERVIASGWRSVGVLRPFAEAADFALFRGRTIPELYRWYCQRVEALAVADVTGRYRIYEDGEVDHCRQLFERIKALDEEITATRRRFRSGIALAEKLSINVAIQKLQRERAELVEEIK